MKKPARNLTSVFLQKLAITIGIAALFCIANVIQRQLLYTLSIGPRSSLFYLPAAVITLGSLVSPVAALSGIFLGSLLMNWLAGDLTHSLDIVLFSFVPTLAASIAVVSTAYFNQRFRDFHSPQDRFSQIDAIDIFYFCSLYAIINVSLSKLLFYYEIQDPIAFPPIMVLGMAFGDLTGSFLVFIVLNVTFSLYTRFR